MTDVMTAGTDTDPVTDPNTPPAQPDALDEQLVGRLVAQARANGLQLTGEGGLLQPWWCWPPAASLSRPGR
jgi:putative transposase